MTKQDQYHAENTAGDFNNVLGMLVNMVELSASSALLCCAGLLSIAVVLMPVLSWQMGSGDVGAMQRECLVWCRTGSSATLKATTQPTPVGRERRQVQVGSEVRADKADRDGAERRGQVPQHVVPVGSSRQQCHDCVAYALAVSHSWSSASVIALLHARVLRLSC